MREPRRGTVAASAQDWRSALDSAIFEPLVPMLDRCPRDRFPSLEDLNRLVPSDARSGGDARIRFVPPGPGSREFEAQYEVRAFRHGEVQTRAGDWHDFFNALVWISFPKTKAVLNRHHFEQMEARRGQRLRGTARDVLTLFDEGGVIVASADPGLSRMLREFQWKELFWRRRADVVRAMRFFVFGHAIYEKALEPHKGVTGKALIVDVEERFMRAPLEAQIAQSDERAAEYFADAASLASTRTLSPLPVLGVPGWEPGNEQAEYYDDTSQFRPGRAAG